MIQLHLGTPALILAPMEGVTDPSMRALLAELGGFTFCVAEYLRISQAVPPPRAILAHVPELALGGRCAAGLPVQVQLLGGDPARLAASAQLAVELGARAIDLNFGCPARTVNRHDGGAALLRFPQRIFAIVTAVRAALPAAVPVSAKMRLGWEDPEDIHCNADMAAAAGAAWITIHGRTRLQGYRPPAYWGPIGQVRRRLAIPVVANGDIWTLDDLRRCQDETGCCHLMLGRGAVADPSLAPRAAVALGLKAPSPSPSAAPDWPALLRRFIALTELHGRLRGLPGRLKQWGKMGHLQGTNGWYTEVRTLSTAAAILAVVERLAVNGPQNTFSSSPLAAATST